MSNQDNFQDDSTPQQTQLFQEQCVLIAQNKAPTWEAWKKLDPKDHRLLANLILRTNHTPLVVELFRQPRFCPFSWDHLREQKYTFPPDITIKQIEDIARAWQENGKSHIDNTVLYVLHVAQALKRVDLLRWSTTNSLIDDDNPFPLQSLGHTLLECIVDGIKTDPEWAQQSLWLMQELAPVPPARVGQRVLAAVDKFAGLGDADKDRVGLQLLGWLTQDDEYNPKLLQTFAPRLKVLMERDELKKESGVGFPSKPKVM